MTTAPNTRTRVAIIVSIIGHPFTLVPCMVALTVRPAWLGVGVAVAAAGAMLAVIACRVASGRWSDYDVSDPGQRHSFYPAALLIVGTSALVGWWLGMPGGAVRGFIVAAGLLAVGAVLTRWSKVSLHMLFGAYCTVVAAGADLRAAAVLALVVGATAWSRVALHRHTVTQVALGIAVGAFGGGVLVWLNTLK